MILTRPGLRWWIAIFVFVFVAFITVLCFIVTLGALGLLSVTLLDKFLGPARAILAVATIAWTVYVPWLTALPLVIPVGLCWRNPARILVFRRFHRHRENAALRSIVRRHLARFGHVFTLADTLVTMPWYVQFPVLLGQSTFMHFRPRRVRRAQDLDRLDALLRERRWLNVNWLLSIRKIFPIECSDEVWQACIARLLPTADLVLIDVSQPSVWIEWELSECARLGVMNRVLAIADRSSSSSASTEALGAVPLFRYLARGRFDDPVGFATTVRTILAQTVPVVGEPAAWRQLAPRLGRAAGLMVLSLSVALFLASPYLFPQSVARWSPFSWQVVPAYFSRPDDAALERLDAELRAPAGRAMITCLADPDCAHRILAAQALPRLATRDLVPSLVELMRMDGPARAAGIDALLAVDAPDLDLYAVEWLAMPKSRSTVEWLAMPRSFVDISISTLQRRATRRTAAPLIAAISMEDKFDMGLDGVLARIVDADSLSALLAARPQTPAAKLLIGRALARLHRAEAASYLLDALKVTEEHWIGPRTHPYEHPATEALTILLDEHVAPRPQAIAHYLAGAAPAATWAVRLLLLGDPASGATVLGTGVPAGDAVAELATLARSSDPAVSGAVASRLATSGAWLRALARQDAQVHEAALFLLARIGDFACVAPAFELARSSADDATAILELLAEHVHPPCSPTVTLADDDSAVVAAYERARARCRRARSSAR